MNKVRTRSVTGERSFMKAERTLSYPIHETLTVREYLFTHGYSRRLLSHLKTTDSSILCNAVPVHTDHLMREGDVLTIRLSEDPSLFPPFPARENPRPFRVIFEDEDILVADKSAHLPVHSSLKYPDLTMAGAVCEYCARQGRPIVYRCINRLDLETTGLLLIARHMLSGCVLSSALKEHRIRRRYVAIVQGKLQGPGVVDAPIARLPGSSIRRCVSFQEGRKAVTHYLPLSYDPVKDLTLTALQLETGRTHQIRIHMQFIGHPLIGDYLYYPDFRYIKRQALHSQYLSFIHPVTGEPLSFSCPLPDDMQRLFPGFSCSSLTAGSLS